jgi:hypothetical protein
LISRLLHGFGKITRTGGAPADPCPFSCLAWGVLLMPFCPCAQLQPPDRTAAAAAEPVLSAAERAAWRDLEKRLRNG